MLSLPFLNPGACSSAHVPSAAFLLTYLFRVDLDLPFSLCTLILNGDVDVLSIIKMQLH